IPPNAAESFEAEVSWGVSPKHSDVYVTTPAVTLRELEQLVGSHQSLGLGAGSDRPGEEADFRVEELPGEGWKLVPLTPRAREYTYGEGVDEQWQRWHESSFVVERTADLVNTFYDLRSRGFRFEQAATAELATAAAEKLTEQEKKDSHLVLLPGD